MEIGEILKLYRKQKKKTQTEFIQGIISESYYSKVENGQHRISAEDLFELLQRNHIALQDFTEYLALDKKRSTVKVFENKLCVLFYEDQLDEIKDMAASVNFVSELSDHEKKLVNVLAEVLTSIIEKGTVSEESKRFLKSKIIEDENWTIQSMKLFKNTLHLYEFEETVFLFQTLIRKRLNFQFDTLNDETKTFTTLLLNFIGICLNKGEWALLRKPLELLARMPKTPDFAFYQLMRLFYIELIHLLHEPVASREKLNQVIEAVSLVSGDHFSQDLRAIVTDQLQ